MLDEFMNANYLTLSTIIYYLLKFAAVTPSNWIVKDQLAFISNKLSVNWNFELTNGILTGFIGAWSRK